MFEILIKKLKKKKRRPQNFFFHFLELQLVVAKPNIVRWIGNLCRHLCRHVFHDETGH